MACWLTQRKFDLKTQRWRIASKQVVCHYAPTHWAAKIQCVVVSGNTSEYICTCPIKLIAK